MRRSPKRVVGRWVEERLLPDRDPADGRVHAEVHEVEAAAAAVDDAVLRALHRRARRAGPVAEAGLAEGPVDHHRAADRGRAPRRGARPSRARAPRGRDRRDRRRRAALRRCALRTRGDPRPVPPRRCVRRRGRGDRAGELVDPARPAHAIRRRGAVRDRRGGRAALAGRPLGADERLHPHRGTGRTSAPGPGTTTGEPGGSG